MPVSNTLGNASAVTRFWHLALLLLLVATWLALVTTLSFAVAPTVSTSTISLDRSTQVMPAHLVSSRAWVNYTSLQLQTMLACGTVGNND